MSDALAILDGAAARVSALLMPEGLGALVAFLRGEAWEEIPHTHTAGAGASAGGGGGGGGAPLPRIPNLLLSCYDYIPLAIAADVSLVSVSSSGERSALVQNFERCDFRVFAVNLMPESRNAGDSLQQKGWGRQNSSSSIIRLNCMEAVRAWCDAVYAAEGGVHHSRSSAAAVKRSRHETESTAAASAWVLSSTSSPRDTAGLCVRRVLFIVRCCADESGGGSGTERSRPPRDPLLLFLHDVSAMAVLCRARQASHQTRIRFSVLLLPDDLAYGGALLEEALREPLSRDYYVQLFRGPTACVAQRDNDDESAGFLHRLEVWLGVATAAPFDDSCERAGGSRDQQLQQSNAAAEEAARRRDSSVFFVRRENLPLCCFLREALRRFPVLLRPTALRQLQALWATRRQLGDVVVGFHTLLSPFALSSSRYRGAHSLAAPTATMNNGPDAEDDGMCRLADSVDILNALLDAAAQWADGHPLNEAVAFAVLYEDLVWRRPERLQRLAGLVAVLQRLWHKRNDGAGLVFHEALASCVPLYTPSSVLSDVPCGHHHAHHHHEQQQQPQAEETTRAVVVLPPAMALPSAKAPLMSELRRSALLAVMPPQESLDEVKRAVSSLTNNNRSGDGGNGSGNDGGPVAANLCGLVASNNFFSTSIPDGVRVLHILTAHALAHTSARQKYVSFSVLRRVCQLSDEELLRALKELQLAGMASLNGREFKARTLLDG
ncbi:hypothetical protein DQ04_09041020 [Trypanosoma grayi]|uniref:hypothetical protein n=1 Tax=Trypanosoma grayi TaxID=71804 RepID=UPI0004F3FDA4|nr:hypothetical protein DQ04_09041020 [Trypanosoma grayi]KEG07704.1 hypothetical protein DQ04_09041020 [Trypanosoma grayi]